MIDLEMRLAELGELLDVPTDVVGADRSTDRDRARSGGGRGNGRWFAAAAVILVVGAVVAIPSSREAVSSWLGLDRVRIERHDDRLPPTTAAVPTDPGPEGSPIVVDGRTVLVATIDGRLSDVTITKTVSVDSPVRALDIDGAPALWVESAHEVLIEVDGVPAVERVAGSTLLWQDGEVLRRVEGFETLDDAVEFARSR